MEGSRTKEAERVERAKRSKRDKIYYMDSYYIRYFFALDGRSHREIERRHRAFLEARGEQGLYPILKRDLLGECCEFMSFKKEKERFGQEKMELIGPLPALPERFVKEFCRFLQMEPEDVFFSVEKDQKEEFQWEKKRKELRERRDEMIRESARLEELLTVVLKVCHIGYLSKIFEYLAEFLRPQTRQFWMDMEKQLADIRERLERLNFFQYLGYQGAIDVAGIETERGWDYPVKDELAFQENEPLSPEIVSSLMKRQGIESYGELAEALSSPEKKVYPAIIRDLVSGEKNGTPLKRKTAVRMGEILHAGWQDMKEENSCFWTVQGTIAVWETAEAQMRQAVRELKPSEWRSFLHGNDESGEAELFLAIKNIIRFSLCGYEAEKNRALLEILEKKITETDKGKNKPQTAADRLFYRCIRELREENPTLTRLAYRLLLNGMNLEHLFQEAFDGELGEPIRQSAEEEIREFARIKTCTDGEKEYLKQWRILRMKSKKRQTVFGGFQKEWLQGIRTSFNDNPWLLRDRKLTITWVSDEECEEAPVLEDEIEVRIQLPRELDELLDPGEISASLPYEKGVGLDELISGNWDIICDAMDESFGQELEGWDAELYDEWRAEVGFESRKVSYESWEPYNVNNKTLDQMTPDERYGNRYELFAALGKENFEKSGNMAAARNKDACYEEGVHLIRIQEKLREGQQETSED